MEYIFHFVDQTVQWSEGLLHWSALKSKNKMENKGFIWERYYLNSERSLHKETDILNLLW